MPEERSLSAEPDTSTPAAPAAAETPFGNPSPSAEPEVVSIVDNILNLDSLLSADVRRAERTARFYLEAWREARIDELQAELDLLTDAQGNPLPVPESSLAEGARTAQAAALELQAEQAAMGRSAQTVRMRQMPDDEWREFRSKWRKALDEGAPFPREMFDELIVASAVQPPISAEQVVKLRSHLGGPPMDELGHKAWLANAESGVSIPKSPLSSHVLRRAQRSRS